MMGSRFPSSVYPDSPRFRAAELKGVEQGVYEKTTIANTGPLSMEACPAWLDCAIVRGHFRCKSAQEWGLNTREVDFHGYVWLFSY